MNKLTVVAVESSSRVRSGVPVPLTAAVSVGITLFLSVPSSFYTTLYYRFIVCNVGIDFYALFYRLFT